MTAKQHVIAVIPNYNMAESLGLLLAQVLEQDYDGVYVLDDASTDNSVAVARSFGGKVTVVAGKTNVGSGANRNRVLEVLPSNSDAIIHFLDADVVLETPNAPTVARHIFKDQRVVLVGGLIKQLSGLQHVWNWGYPYTPYTMVSMQVAYQLEKLTNSNPQLAQKYWRRLRLLVARNPNPFVPPVAQDVLWVAEANMLVRARVFRELGGFDANLRVHDIMDIAIKLKKRGHSCRFDPSIVVTHKAINVRPPGRRQEELRATGYLLKKHGRHVFF